MAVIVVKTSRHIDWISVTIPGSANWRNFIPFADLALMGTGRHGYGQSWQDRRTGAVIETASARDDMGTHLTLSGDVLQTMRDDLGSIDDSLCQRIHDYDGKVSRLDLCIDCLGAAFTPYMLARALRRKKARIRARKWRYIDGHDNGVVGDTVDTGSPKSDVRFRFYDKSAEKRIKDGEAWVRLEIQLRRVYARSAFGSCLENGTHATTAGIIGQYLSWQNSDYQQTLTDAAGVTLTVPRKESKRKMWLLGQVAKALASEVYADPYFLEKFTQAMRYFLDQYREVDK